MHTHTHNHSWQVGPDVLNPMTNSDVAAATGLPDISTAATVGEAGEASHAKETISWLVGWGRHHTDHRRCNREPHRTCIPCIWLAGWVRGRVRHNVCDCLGRAQRAEGADILLALWRRGHHDRNVPVAGQTSVRDGGEGHKMDFIGKNSNTSAGPRVSFRAFEPHLPTKRAQGRDVRFHEARQGVLSNRRDQGHTSNLWMLCRAHTNKHERQIKGECARVRTLFVCVHCVCVLRVCMCSLLQVADVKDQTTREVAEKVVDNLAREGFASFDGEMNILQEKVRVRARELRGELGNA